MISQDLRSALVAVVRRRVPESEVEDIVQATLADAIGSPHAPSEADAFRRWIFGIAKHKVVDYHRRAGRETFEVPDLAGQGAPHVEADLLRWAERHLPPGEENQTTLDWMLREGEGEKLESIAETEQVPAPRVRQRVSRLRRHLKAHWQKEVALLVAVGVIVTVFFVMRRPDEPQPIAKDGTERAEELRKIGIEKCRASEWATCVENLDAAKRLDPAGDSRPEIRQARENAEKALAPAPTSSSLTLPPVPTSSAAPLPTSSGPTFIPKPKPFSTETLPPPKAPPTSKYEGSSELMPSKVMGPSKENAAKKSVGTKSRPITKAPYEGEDWNGAPPRKP